jgi:thioredoxin 1
MEISHKGFISDYADNAPSIEQLSCLDGFALIEFGTPWCGICQAAQPVIKQVLGEHPDLLHLKIYDGKGKPLGRAFQVKLWPTLILLNNGKEVARLVRPVRADDVRALLAKSRD